MREGPALRRLLPMIGFIVPFLLSGAGCTVGHDRWAAGGNGHTGPGAEEPSSPAASSDSNQPPSGGAQPGTAPPSPDQPTTAQPGGAPPTTTPPTTTPPTAALPAEDEGFRSARMRMVADQIESRGVRDPLVLEAMRKVQRHRFVPEGYLPIAYDDGPLPIGEGQTISQPYIVALMTELLKLSAGQKVLEVGTGSGYQAAVLAEMGLGVYSIEIVEPLAVGARQRLETMGYKGIRFRIGDGYRGWPEAAPFDGIIVTAAPDHIPQPLLDQLKVKGRLVIPVGAFSQDLIVVTRTPFGTSREEIIPVRFVPMTGEAQQKPH